jgi:microcystin-dependent protein
MSQPFLGQLSLFPFSFPPRGWAICQGQLLPIQQFQALFSVIGTTYGGNGQTTFALPDLQGRVAVSVGNGIVLGEKAGTEQVTLIPQQVPAHTHTINATVNAVNSPSPSNTLLGQTPSGGVNLYKQNTSNLDSPLNVATIKPFGGSLPHENRSPYLVLNWCIALVGIFPSRT